MFEASNLLCIYVETSLHAGTGRGLGTIDLPIQRERITGYPIVQGSGLKGRLRAEAEPRLSSGEFEAIFGPKTDNADAHAGALSCGDAKILLLPVRSLAGVFAWVTSRQVLARLLRDLAAIPTLQPVYQELEAQLAIIRVQPAEPTSDADERWALVGDESSVKAGERVVLEEFAFAPNSDDGTQKAINKIGEWVAKNALPQTEEYKYWRENLSKHLVILPEDDFRDFCLFGMEVVTRIKLKTETKTVDKETGSLWTEEHLPADTLLYAPLHATHSRKIGNGLTAEEILEKVNDLNLPRIMLGGNETVGRGIVCLHFLTPNGGVTSGNGADGEEGETPTGNGDGEETNNA